ncbi:MAG: dienelactone hydrolase family protein [Burkholderiales bacterium]|jgi:carboxymethylenebutenolidase|nr:dienelactone hydrolase family protein [Burkholderiales bacterium]
MNLENKLTPTQQAEWNSLYPKGDTSRRRFVVSSLAAGFALATQPIMAQTAITTDEKDLKASEIKIPTADGELLAYRACPEKGEKLPTVLVVQEIFGVHDYIKDICRRFAKLGYLAIAPELFARYGDPRQYSNVQMLMTELVSKVPDHEVMDDLDACAKWAAQNSGDAARLAISGFCWGGRATWLYCAHSERVKAGVAWYGRLEGENNERTPAQPLERVDALKAPVLGLYGEKDSGIPLASVEKMRTALKTSKSSAARASEIKVYPDAPHAFHADYRPSFRREPAEDGWQQLLQWFKKNGV